jgi:hypothetical protein
VNLHDWIDELMDTLDIEVELDEALVLDVAREAAHQVQRPAAPISTFLLGYAAGLAGGATEDVERLAARVIALADRWEGGDGDTSTDTSAHMSAGTSAATVDTPMVDAEAGA